MHKQNPKLSIGNIMNFTNVGHVAPFWDFGNHLFPVENDQRRVHHNQTSQGNHYFTEWNEQEWHYRYFGRTLLQRCVNNQDVCRMLDETQDG